MDPIDSELSATAPRGNFLPYPSLRIAAKIADGRWQVAKISDDFDLRSWINRTTT